MDYHYSENDMANDSTMSGYAEEFSPQFLIPTKEADYELRSSMLVDGGDRFGVSSAVFDKYEELIWMGNQGGHVTSYHGPTMQKYTSFQVHATDEIRDIVTHEHSLFILTKSQLRQQIRRGLPKHTYKSANMVEMQCLYQESPTKLLMGGHQDKLLELDITKMTETVIPIDEKGCAVLRSSGGSLVACGSACGTVTLRDVRTPNSAEHTFKAHSACLSDLDMQGDLLITCGFAHSNEEAVAESYVIVWDVRYLRNKGKEDNVRVVPTVSPPLLLHFLPAFSGRAVACAGDGHVALLHLNSTSEKQAVFQVDTQSTACTVMDVAATSQALVFGDQSGHLNLFSPQHNNEPRFNQFSRATELPTQTDLPTVSFNNTSFRYNSLPAPTLTTGSRWANEMPINFYRRVYRKPKPIDPEVLKTMKMQGPIGYAPNPKTCRRNEMPYTEDRLEDLQATRQDRSATQPIPQRYVKLDLRFNRCSANEAILNTMSLTGMPGIEATLPNSYCNSMLQVLYYIAPLKATLLAHTCAKEFCLSCELGFLFRMLDTSGGSPCQASNFLRAFRTVPEAAALGLILSDRGLDHRVDLVALIQSWNRFILHQMHYEILETRRKELELQIIANSPPKGRISLKNGPIPMPPINGHYDKYQFTEIEFLGPAEFDEELREDPWLTGREEGICESEPINPNQNSTSSPNENHELESKKSGKEESEISQLFAIGRHQLNRCLKCNKEEGRESVVLACALQYPSVASRETEQRGSFIELIRASLSSRRSTPAWCEQCGKFTPTSQRGRLIRLPPILAINCGGVNVREKAYWAKGSQKEMPETKRGASSKPCRYGLHCARPGCHFKHPESPNASQSSSTRSPTHESSCVLPLQLLIRLQADGDVIVNDKLHYETTSEPNSPNHRIDSKFKRKIITTATDEEYSLTAAVVCVEDNPKNLVAFIQTDGRDSDWYLFNDLSITPVSVEEVVQFSAWWKTPCVLFYTSAKIRDAAEPNS